MVPVVYFLFDAPDCEYRTDIYASLLLSMSILTILAVKIINKSLSNGKRAKRSYTVADVALYIPLQTSAIGLVYLQYLSSVNCDLTHWKLCLRWLFSVATVSGIAAGFVGTALALLRDFELLSTKSRQKNNLNLLEESLKKLFKTRKGWNLFSGKYTKIKKLGLAKLTGSGNLSTAYIYEYVSWAFTKNEEKAFPSINCTHCQDKIQAGHRVIPRFGKCKQPVHMHCQYSASAILDQWTSYTLKLLYTMSKDDISDPKDLRQLCLEDLYKNFDMEIEPRMGCKEETVYTIDEQTNLHVLITETEQFFNPDIAIDSPDTRI